MIIMFPMGPIYHKHYRLNFLRVMFLKAWQRLHIDQQFFPLTESALKRTAADILKLIIISTPVK